MTKLHELADLGQSIWFDYIRRSFITSGDLQALIDDGLRGITSNPAIFEKAIAGSSDYDKELHRLVDEGNTVPEIYEALALDDIARAADLMQPVYDQTGGLDGYVSLEVDPNLARDTEGTIADARRLFATLGRPNVMIKVPATPEGIPAIETLIGEGINVNVTLIFSVAQYEAAAGAYIAGLEKLSAAGGDVSKAASVASFFVSRVDVAVDRELEKTQYPSLMGKAAIASGKIAYARFREIFSGGQWEKLAARGARVQRILWASTGTKNPAYSDTLYVDSLVGPDTVNTVPPPTLNAFRDHGTVALTLEDGLDDACALLSQLASLGIDLDAVTDKLLDEGVIKFAKAFASLMDTIAEKRDRLLAGWRHQAAGLGDYQAAVDAALAEMEAGDVIAHIWKHDHTVWKPEPAEITNRLGWLHIAETMMENVPRVEALAAEVQEAGYTHVLLLGMGGSSLAPELFSKVFGAQANGLSLAVLDSTDPGAVLDQAMCLDPARTLFVVATKSGSTAETLSFLKFFYNLVANALGTDKAGEHFVAITDPGSKLVDSAERYGFRACLLNDPNIGGRFSALSYFGLAPAALAGVDVRLLLERAVAMMRACGPGVSAMENPGAWLGAILGELAKSGRDKVTFAISPAIASFGDWVEQLVAESTGKEGKGILPVVGEPLGTVGVYGFDRLFVHIRLDGDTTCDADLAALEAAGHPVVRLNLRDVYDFGGQFFLWELATAVAGHRLNVNPFNQPNVESAKVQARKMIAEYRETGALPSLTPALSGDGITVYGDLKAIGPEKALTSFLSQSQLAQARKVVIIEDEPEMVDLVKLILGRKGIELIGAVGGEEGLEVVRREKPDLVLLDLMMPDMDGWEVYQRMKTDVELRDIPVVVITAKAHSLDRALGLQIAELAGLSHRKVIETPGEALIAFLGQAQMWDYVALQAYVQPTLDTSMVLDELRLKLRDRFRLATTVGYGPRFLHSTGQLHKGDRGNGLFIQFTHDPPQDAAIPDQAGSPESSMTFGVLIAAQALGDRQALLDSGRRVICFHLGDDVVGGLKKLDEAL